jgi:hypothetical protein
MLMKLTIGVNFILRTNFSHERRLGKKFIRKTRASKFDEIDGKTQNIRLSPKRAQVSES